jgi:hypothetical protein
VFPEWLNGCEFLKSCPPWSWLVIGGRNVIMNCEWERLWVSVLGDYTRILLEILRNTEKDVDQESL